MESSLKIKKLSAGIIFILIVLNCSPGAENKLNKAIELYNTGDTSKALTGIEDSLIHIILIKKLNENRLIQGENFLAYRQNNFLKVVWPLEKNIDITENYNIISYNPDLKKLGISNGYDIKIYNSEASLIKTCGPPPDDKRIKAITFVDGKVLYYKNTKLFLYDIDSDTETLMSNDKLLSPFTNESCDVRFYKTENFLTVTAGIAGRYNICIFDLKNNSLLFQNQNAASSKIFFNKDIIYFVTGNAGKYSLVEAAISSKKIKNLTELDTPTDIEFFSSGILLEDKDGLWIVDYNNNRQKIPFGFELAGQCGGQPVMKYLNVYYITDLNKLKEKLSYIKEKIPVIFDDISKK